MLTYPHCHCQLISTTYDIEPELCKVVEEAAEEIDGDLDGWKKELKGGDSGEEAKESDGDLGTILLMSRSKRNCKRSSRRRKKRKYEAEGLEEERKVKQVALNRRQGVVERGEFVSVPTVVLNLKAAEGGWQGSQGREPLKPARAISDLLSEGFQLVGWDGRTPTAALDRCKRVVVVLAGAARGSFEEEVIHPVTAAFKTAGEPLGSECLAHSRGDFHTVRLGFSHGGGTSEPNETAFESAAYREAANSLKCSHSLKRLAGFQEQAFKVFFPEIYAYYQGAMSQLLGTEGSLACPFVSSFPSAALNLGPRTVCMPHRDSKNLSFGICCITALGNFDSTTGGHLVLEELKLIVQFPPGATVLIPSAVITHWNIEVPEGQERFSFTQYASGQLFAYVANGMKTDKELALTASLAEMEKWKQDRKGRWAECLSKFPTLSDYK